MQHVNHYQSSVDYHMDSRVFQRAASSVLRQIQVKPTREARINPIFQQQVVQKPYSNFSHSDINRCTSGKDFYPAVPIDTYQKSGASIYGCFDFTRLPQTPAVDLLNGKVSSLEYHGQPYHSLAKTLKSRVNSVGAIANSDGSLGSGILIGKNLLLVARHSVAGIPLNDMTVELGYLQQRGRHYRISHVLEEDAALDYAILVVDGDPGATFPPAKLELEEQSICQDLPLLHHPLNKPLQVSVHAFGPQRMPSRITTFHDSDYCSSGGGYLNHRGNVIAMHLGAEVSPRHGNLPRGAITLTEIARQVPDGVIAQLANGQMRQDVAYESHDPLLFLAPNGLNLFFDEEGKNPKAMLKKEESKYPHVKMKKDQKGDPSTKFSAMKHIQQHAPTLHHRVLDAHLNHGLT